jgi:hypothetical protein
LTDSEDISLSVLEPGGPFDSRTPAATSSTAQKAVLVFDVRCADGYMNANEPPPLSLTTPSSVLSFGVQTHFLLIEFSGPGDIGHVNIGNNSGRWVSD